MHPPYYRGCWHGVSRCFLCGYRQVSSPLTDLYTPKGLINHAALLRQGFPHCAKFPTAASRRSMGRVSVPLWGAFLSEPLPIAALVGRYPANQLIGREPIRRRRNFQYRAMRHNIPSGISRRFHRLSPGNGHVAHALRTLPPVAARILLSRAAPRLACVKPAASVHPEPGSNSSLYIHCFSRSTPTTSFLIK